MKLLPRPDLKPAEMPPPSPTITRQPYSPGPPQVQTRPHLPPQPQRQPSLLERFHSFMMRRKAVATPAGGLGPPKPFTNQPTWDQVFTSSRPIQCTIDFEHPYVLDRPIPELRIGEFRLFNVTPITPISPTIAICTLDHFAS